MSDDRDDIIPRGTCTALRCVCSEFVSRPDSKMYCKNCGHSVEHHHLDARDVLA